MSDMLLVCMLLVRGCQTLVMGPTSLLQQSLVNTVPHCKMLHWYSLLSGREFQILTKIWLHFWQHIIDVWHLPSVCVACKWLSDLGNGPNKPTATIIGEHIQCLIARCCTGIHSGQGKNFRFWQKSGYIFDNIHHWCLACSQCVCSL